MPSISSSRVLIDDEVRPATVRFEAGKVVEIGEQGIADHEFGDLVVMPGLVDSHVHVNDPGRAEWEGFGTATRAAAAGGTTTIVDMPLNSIPPTVDPGGLEAKRRAAAGHMSVDVAFWGGLIPGSGQHLGSLVAAGVCGFKSFLVDSGVPEFPPVTIEELETAVPVMADLGVPALIHAEDPHLITSPSNDETEYGRYLESRPVEAESVAVADMAALARRTGAAVHLLHLSSGEALDELESGPSGLTGETCPHYLTFCAEDIPSGATQFKCAPPIREAGQRERLWEGLRRGIISIVVSDHSPAPRDLKAVDTGDFGRAWGGIGSLELRLQATWTGACERGFELTDMCKWLSAAPATLAGLDDRKGSISVGKDADFVIWDPDGATEVVADRLNQRQHLTPYEGMTLRGRVRSTILAGAMICDDGVIVEGGGRMLARR
ncbi:MAG: allantoinase AllB [Acidimicrobiia bacterium]